MNRRQRRQAQRQGRVEMVNLNEITWPWQMDDETTARALGDRAANNVQDTGHPLHHRTVNGAIVAPDPTLEYYVKRLNGKDAYQQLLAHIQQIAQDCERRDIPAAVPVNRKYYGRDMYEGR